jgi:RimJ/RimL family protein N-acetyltransferase
MHLTFRGISLRPVLEDDLPFLFRLVADPTRSYLWRRSTPVHDEASFCQNWSSWTAGIIAAKFVVESTGRPVGLVFDYDRTVEDGWTRATTLLQEENVGRGAGVIATALFMDWLFQTLPFRKVYHEAYGYNETVLRMWRKLGLIEEGVLKGDRYWNGAYWNLHIFALYREVWPQVRDRVLRVPGTRIGRASSALLSTGKEVGPTEHRIPSNGCLSGAE